MIMSNYIKNKASISLDGDVKSVEAAVTKLEPYLAIEKKAFTTKGKIITYKENKTGLYDGVVGEERNILYDVVIKNNSNISYEDVKLLETVNLGYEKSKSYELSALSVDANAYEVVDTKEGSIITFSLGDIEPLSDKEVIFNMKLSDDIINADIVTVISHVADKFHAVADKPEAPLSILVVAHNIETEKAVYDAQGRKTNHVIGGEEFEFVSFFRNLDDTPAPVDKVTEYLDSNFYISKDANGEFKGSVIVGIVETANIDKKSIETKVVDTDYSVEISTDNTVTITNLGSKDAADGTEVGINIPPKHTLIIRIIGKSTYQKG